MKKNIADHIRSLALVMGLAAGLWVAAGHHIPGHFTAGQRAGAGAIVAVVILLAGLLLGALVSAGSRSRRPAPRQADPPRPRSYGGYR
jgi:hypothetical protein